MISFSYSSIRRTVSGAEMLTWHAEERDKKGKLPKTLGELLVEEIVSVER